VTSFELFEGSTQFNTTHFSSLDNVKPIVYSKHYIVQKAFDAMQVTLTEKGITTKDIIVASQFGVIYEIPWILIDSRRPIKITDVER
jgi:ER membrane protein complex subunit 1